jgi:prevent-host-death family protein
MAASASAGRPPSGAWAIDEAQVYTMRDLNQHTAEVMKEIEERKMPAFITRHGRFVAIITPLEPGQVESRVLAEVARQINKRPSQ